MPSVHPGRLRTIEVLGDVSGKRVLVRSDLNVPLRDGRISDDLRIRATAPTLQELLGAGAGLVVCSHLGRPKGKVVEELRLAPVADRLSEVLGLNVTPLDVVVGDKAREASSRMKPGQVVLLENLRFE